MHSLQMTAHPGCACTLVIKETALGNSETRSWTQLDSWVWAFEKIVTQLLNLFCCSRDSRAEFSYPKIVKLCTVPLKELQSNCTFMHWTCNGISPNAKSCWCLRIEKPSGVKIDLTRCAAAARLSLRAASGSGSGGRKERRQPGTARLTSRPLQINRILYQIVRSETFRNYFWLTRVFW